VLVVFGLCVALAGGLAALAGVTARRRAQRLRTSGLTAWAMVVPNPSADPDDPGRRRRVLIQYRLPDGSLIERAASRLTPGQRVLVWYDPADPADALVFGQEGHYADAAFAVVGIAFILLGVAIAGH
jgi:uncharacterized protein DUF3592